MTLKELLESQDSLVQKRENLIEKMSNAANEGKTDVYDAASRELNIVNQKLMAAKDKIEFARSQKPVEKSANQQMREVIKGVREHRIEGDIALRSDSQAIISSGIIASGDLNNMTSAGLPVTVGDLVNPLEMGTIYDKVGIKIATGVHGTLQWPVLDTIAQVSVAGETTQLSGTPLDFSKITATPVRLGITISVDNEAINDAAFDLVGTIKTQISKALGRTINEAVLKTTAFNANFKGPFTNSRVQSVTFTTTGAPTYAELLAMKGKVLAKGAQMAGFCYVMDAAMYSLLEATPTASGSGLMIIQNGKINGDPVFLTDLASYSGKVAAGCFGYVALNQHGDSHFVIDPYTLADKNSVKFTYNANWSLTTLQGYPFVVGA